MPAARPLMSQQAEQDIHDIAVVLKLMLLQQMASHTATSGTFDAYLRGMFTEDLGFARLRSLLDLAERIDPGTGELRAVA